MKILLTLVLAVVMAAIAAGLVAGATLLLNAPIGPLKFGPGIDLDNVVTAAAGAFLGYLIMGRPDGDDA